MTAPVVGIYGGKALRRDLNKMCTQESGPLFNAMKRAGYAAAKPVVSATRSDLPTSDTEHSGRLSNTVRASGTKTGAAVRMGKASVPYAGWVDFGGTRPDGSSRDYLASGRYLFPAAQGLANTVGQLYESEMGKVFASNRVWTNTTSDGTQVHD